MAHTCNLSITRKQEDLEFQASLGYLLTLYLNTEINKQTNKNNKKNLQVNNHLLTTRKLKTQPTKTYNRQLENEGAAFLSTNFGGLYITNGEYTLYQQPVLPVIIIYSCLFQLLNQFFPIQGHCFKC